MTITRAEERRLLTGMRFGAVGASYYPDLAGMLREEVQALARHLCDQRNQLRDQSRGQRWSRSGQSEHRSAHAAGEAELFRCKEATAAALRRLNGQMDRAFAEAKAGRNAERLWQVLKQRRAAPMHHPASGRTGNNGMRPAENEGRRTCVNPGVIGSVFQQSKGFRGRTDVG